MDKRDLIGFHESVQCRCRNTNNDTLCQRLQSVHVPSKIGTAVTYEGESG